MWHERLDPARLLDAVAGLQARLTEVEGQRDGWKSASENDRAQFVAASERLAEVEREREDLRERNHRMRDYIGRHGFGHTDWPSDPIGCDGPGPGCVGMCIARCENVDNLNARIYATRADLAEAQRSIEGYAYNLDQFRSSLATAEAHVQALERGLEQTAGAHAVTLERLVAAQARVRALEGALRLAVDNLSCCYVCDGPDRGLGPVIHNANCPVEALLTPRRHEGQADVEE